ncbi:hypothetical protein, partial [Streptomyces spongiae]|uniref:hypothetical protein n=1 Tax=Streptomyces spongiae TaxID=565072 RepID=UPI0038998F4C
MPGRATQISVAWAGGSPTGAREAADGPADGLVGLLALRSERAALLLPAAAGTGPLPLPSRAGAGLPVPTETPVVGGSGRAPRAEGGAARRNGGRSPSGVEDG